MTMPDFLQFFSGLLGAVADFLLTPPIVWFTACALLLCVGAIVRRIIN